jgi:hypothetical protein
VRAIALASLLGLAACGGGEAGPASQRGFFGGLFAWVGGTDSTRAAALEAEAARRERDADAARSRADAASADLARSQGETIAARQLARSPAAAADLLRQTVRGLDQVNAQGRRRADILAELGLAARRGLVPPAQWATGRQEARADLDTMLLWMAQAEGMAGRLLPAARTAPALRAPLADLQERRAQTAITAAELQRVIAGAS